MRWLGVVARLVIGGVWIAAGAMKLPDPAESVRAVRAYQLLPETVVPTVGYALPVIELVSDCAWWSDCWSGPQPWSRA